MKDTVTVTELFITQSREWTYLLFHRCIRPRGKFQSQWRWWRRSSCCWHWPRCTTGLTVTSSKLRRCPWLHCRSPACRLKCCDSGFRIDQTIPNFKWSSLWYQSGEAITASYFINNEDVLMIARMKLVRLKTNNFCSPSARKYEPVTKTHCESSKLQNTFSKRFQWKKSNFYFVKRWVWNLKFAFSLRSPSYKRMIQTEQ